IGALRVLASALLSRGALIVFPLVTLATVAAVGGLEMSGGLHNAYSDLTTPRRIFSACIAYVVIVVTVRSLAEKMFSALREAHQREQSFNTAEQAGRLSEERFEKIFRTSPDAIVISRLSDGRYLEVNQRWLDL